MAQNKSSWVEYFLQKAGTWGGCANHSGRHSEIPGTPSGSRLRTGYKHKTSIHQLLWPIGQQKGCVHHYFFLSNTMSCVSVKKASSEELAASSHWRQQQNPKTQFLSTVALFTMQRDPYTDVLLPYYFTLFNHRINVRITVLMLSHCHNYLSHQFDGRKNWMLCSTGNSQ